MLHPGVFRRSEFNETAVRIMFYDMGATATTASIVEYKTVVPTKGKGSKEPVPTLEVLSVGCVGKLLPSHINQLTHVSI